ncbi:MAG: hypothetical protein V3V97_11755, partial [Hyphomicrobiaceae bacterium]
MQYDQRKSPAIALAAIFDLSSAITRTTEPPSPLIAKHVDVSLHVDNISRNDRLITNRVHG